MNTKLLITLQHNIVFYYSCKRTGMEIYRKSLYGIIEQQETIIFLALLF